MIRVSPSFDRLACGRSRSSFLAPILFLVEGTILDLGWALSVVDARDVTEIPETTLGAWVALGAFIAVEVIYFGTILRAWLKYRRDKRRLLRGQDQ